MAVATPKIPHSNAQDGITSHAVSRSSELLSCAKTALKIAKAEYANDDDYGGTMWWACQQPNELSLCSSWKDQPRNGSSGPLDGLCEDGLSLLRTMDAELTQLESLVRRRGHTNDPTEEISASVRRLETDAKELATLVKTGFNFPKANAQYQRHTQLIASWLQSVAQQQTAKLKEILKVRGNVLADQAQRRKLLNPQGPKDPSKSSYERVNGSSSSAKATPHLIPDPPQKRAAPKAMDTPLFTMTSPLSKPGANPYQRPNPADTATATAASTNYTNGGSISAPTTGATTQPKLPSSAPYGNMGSSGGAYGGPSSAAATSSSTSTGAYGGGYGGYGGASSYYGGTAASTGMRQRRPKASAYNEQQQQQQERDEQEDIQAQIQMRQQQRQTEKRLQDAQQAEQTLAQLGTMFNKMTNLITQQGEVLEKVEDDVEAGLSEVEAGQQEITKLYALKKGNRGLIIKVFSLLIFLIIFMRFYKK